MAQFVIDVDREAEFGVEYIRGMKIGHAWARLVHEHDGQRCESSWGFYPSGVQSPDNIHVPNAEYVYEVSDVTARRVEGRAAQLKSAPPNYSVFRYNCVS